MTTPETSTDLETASKRRDMLDLYARALATMLVDDPKEPEDGEYYDQPFAVVQSDNESRLWIAPCRTYDEAIRNAKGCVEQDSAYAWWPLAILDVVNMRVEIVDVAINITTREVPA
jgi:hypothetical protein